MTREKKLGVKETDGPMVKQIDGSTQVIFTMKNFFALISTILGLFFGFYLLVVEPRIKKTEDHHIDMYNEQKELNKTFTNEIVAIKLKLNITSESMLLRSQATDSGATKSLPTEISNGGNYDILANITKF